MLLRRDRWEGSLNKVEDGGKWLVIGSDKDGEADLAIGRQQAPYHDRR